MPFCECTSAKEFTSMESNTKKLKVEADVKAKESIASNSELRQCQSHVSNAEEKLGKMERSNRALEQEIMNMTEDQKPSSTTTSSSSSKASSGTMTSRKQVAHSSLSSSSHNSPLRKICKMLKSNAGYIAAAALGGVTALTFPNVYLFIRGVLRVLFRF